jgi:hypothetical protein
MKPLDRLRQQYIKTQETWNGRLILKNCYEYDAMRLFCLDCKLVSFNDIELMESDVNNTLIQDTIDVDDWSK